MSGREFKPGDVAIVRDEDNQTHHAIVVSAENPGGLHVVVPTYAAAHGMDKHQRLYFGDGAVRSLVAIDLDDMLAVERLVDLYHSQGHGIHANAMRAALREFVDPKPRIEEPTGLGAVVEDAEGRTFVRVADPIDGWMAGKQWQRIGGEINAVRNFGWADLRDVVRVLSEGVTS